jgi:hypothetical protein
MMNSSAPEGLAVPVPQVTLVVSLLNDTNIISSAVDRGFEPRLAQTKDYKIGIFCFFAKHAALKILSLSILLAEKLMSC